MARNLINVEKEKQTFFDLETVKKVKKRNAHSRICNMARKMKVMENEKHPLDHLKNDEITD